jgi:hypothetical protein
MPNEAFIHAADKDFVVASQLGEKLYHFSDVPPEVIFSQGIKAKHADITSVYDMQAKRASLYVSTTRNDDFWSHRKEYRYDIDPSRDPVETNRTGVDVNATIVKSNRTPRLYEEEVVFTGTIDPKAITAVNYYGPNTDPPSFKKILNTGVWDASKGAVAWSNQERLLPPPSLAQAARMSTPGTSQASTSGTSQSQPSGQPVAAAQAKNSTARAGR